MQRLLQYIILSISLLLLLSPKTVSAASNFTTDYHAVYTINDSGVTNADLSIILTNTSEKHYAEVYQMDLGFDDISNLKASDGTDSIKTELKKTDDGHRLVLPISRKALGLGSELNLKVTFDTKSVAQKSGTIWGINIPGISDPNEFRSFRVELKTPTSFGAPRFVKPKSPSNSLSFSKEQLGKSGISIAFGEKQIYSFSLNYHLKNQNLYPIKTKIALPPNTNYQSIYINEINPRPDIVTVDRDGNWLAEYSLLPTQKKDIIVKGVSEIKLTPQKVRISTEETALYTKQTKYWQSNDKQIQKLAKTLNNPSKIYDYVVKTLKYDFGEISQNKSRLGAVNALENPTTAVCREFTDLFIALARSQGIPAREVNGYAYTKNDRQRPLSLTEDVLHAWPEYYDREKATWIMIDPTWGATTGGVDYFNVLDFDHFAFVIKGVDDSYPIPAGGYKSDQKTKSKDVDVSFGKETAGLSANVEIKSAIPTSQIAGLPVKGKVKLVNSGSGASSPQTFYASSKNLSPRDLGTQIPLIPPYGEHDVDVRFGNTSFLTNNTALVTMRFNGKSKEQEIKVAPFFLTTTGIGGVAIGISAFILLIIAGKSRSLRLRR